MLSQSKEKLKLNINRNLNVAIQATQSVDIPTTLLHENIFVEFVCPSLCLQQK